MSGNQVTDNMETMLASPETTDFLDEESVPYHFDLVIGSELDGRKLGTLEDDAFLRTGHPVPEDINDDDAPVP